ncbi:hypothetical protein ACFQNE_09575 [Gordonia phosphorivorans]|uniref:Tetratricopeptide repeat protein n=1 Tax=Gordonia phosphorivorans TaxID=1056982 RepID=A0ABV6H8W5_9ACTN
MVPEISLQDRIYSARILNDPVRTAANTVEIAGSLGEEDMWLLAELLRADRDSDFRNLGADVSAAWFLQRIPTDATQWYPLLSTWLTALRDPADRHDAFEIVSSAITWRLRSERPACLNALGLGRVITELEHGSDEFDTDLSILLQAARYDFNFERIEQILNAVSEGTTNSSLYYRAMLQYSRLGRGKEVSLADVSAIADATESEKILSLLLHGLWFTAGAEWSSEMLKLCDRLIAINPHNAITYMRKAAAHRRKGDFSLAIAAINKAIAMHSPLDRETHADLKLERVTIATQQDEALRLSRVVEQSSNRLNGEIESRVTAADTRLTTRFTTLADQTDAQISDSLFKVVEILGIFTAIIGVVATTIGSQFGNSLSFWERAAILVLGGVVVIGFFFLLRFIVRPHRSPLAHRETE